MTPAALLDALAKTLHDIPISGEELGRLLARPRTDRERRLVIRRLLLEGPDDKTARVLRSEDIADVIADPDFPLKARRRWEVTLAVRRNLTRELERRYGVFES